MTGQNETLASRGLILLIDDEEVIREIGSEMLETMEMTCICAENGEKGLELFRKRKDEIFLVILDIELPGQSGEKVYEELVKIKPDVKVLFSSGYGKEYLESRFFKSGKMRYFMPKPFQLNELTRTINQLLGEDSRGK